MPVTISTRRVDFHACGVRCAGWLTLPSGPGTHPAVVLAHGFGATHDMMLPQYEKHFAAAGIATFAFDYRNTGDSDGNRDTIFRCDTSAPTSRRRWTLWRDSPLWMRPEWDYGEPASAG